jgi:hypothetical protein
MLVGMIVATKQALDYTGTVRAMLVCVIGWIIYWLVILLFFIVFGGF